MTTIFVYGTLMTGECRHAHLAREGSRLLGTGRTLPRFALFQEPNADYPCMVEVEDDEEGVAVAGELWEVTDDTLAILDKVEGVPDWFVHRAITLEDGREVQAYLMAARPAVARSLGDRWR